MSATPPGLPHSLPDNPDDVLRMAAQSMFDTFARTAMGMMVVDRAHRVVWISEGYKRFLPALGFDSEASFVGRRVEDVVPNTQIPQVIESGRPIVADLLTNQAGTFLVSRMPLRDEDGTVIGALGLVLMDHPETTMQPLMTKFGRLQRELDEARKALAAQRRPRYTIASFIGSSPQALEVKRQARRAAATDSTVLLLGETGTGKELLAQGIHAASHRASRPFVGVNIAAVPESLLEAEFFGVAPGAYTGADRKGREGKFVLADGGTLFLDEIGDMPLALQAKLLRVLQEQEVEPLGSNRVQRIDVRVVAATSRDVATMVQNGEFRADLYYRLNVLPLHVPALRERMSDLDALVDALAEDIARRAALPQRSLAADALEQLAQRRWPGNIRELRNVLEQAMLMTDDLLLGAEHFGGSRLGVSAAPGQSAELVRPLEGERDSGRDPAPLNDPLPVERATTLPERVAQLERAAIAEALAATQGNRLAAARRLGIARATLYEKLARWPELMEGYSARRDAVSHRSTLS